MLKGVIFDMDGVIVDSHSIHKKAWRRFLTSAGKNVSDSELEFVLDGRKREDILVYFLGPLSAQQIVDYGHQKEKLFRGEAASMKAIEGLHAFLDELKAAGIRSAVASCGSRRRVLFVLELLNITDHFSAIITGDDITRGKPDPTIFLRAAEEINCPPEASLVIEDAVAGVIAAKAARMKCLAIVSNGRMQALRDAGADEIVRDFTEIPLNRLRTMFHQ